MNKKDCFILRTRGCSIFRTRETKKKRNEEQNVVLFLE